MKPSPTAGESAVKPNQSGSGRFMFSWVVIHEDGGSPSTSADADRQRCSIANRG